MLSESQGNAFLKEQERMDALLEAQDETWVQCYERARKEVYPKVYRDIFRACMENECIPLDRYGFYAAGYAAVNAMTYAVEDLSDPHALIKAGGDITGIYEAYAHYVAEEETNEKADEFVAHIEMLLEGDES